MSEAIEAELRAVRETLQEIKGWLHKHDGQGEGTTHSTIRDQIGKLNSDVKAQNVRFGLIGAAALAIWTALVKLWNGQ